MSTLTATLRHFGPADPTPLAYVRQAGVRDVVTALHHVPVGEVWTKAAIAERCNALSAAGLRWTVIESLPVSEAIKTRTGAYRQHLDNYVTSLRNLAAVPQAPRVVTYNFMPVLDWTRTQLDYPLPSGATALRFDRAELALFDLHLLRRPGAAADYPEDVRERAAAAFAAADLATQQRIQRTLLAGLPGSEESWTLDQFRDALAPYAGVTAVQLRSHLIEFLKIVVPVAQELSLKLAIHPDDPPFSLLGLPRVLSTGSDFAELTKAVPEPANGLCFCTGSFGVRPDNDLPALVRCFADRIHFAHLRSTRREADGSFYEADHLDGDVPMRAVVSELLRAATDRNIALPFRPDHGHRMLDDLTKPDTATAPGYTAIGRLRGLAELRGLIYGLTGAN